ncbi:MAG TPA: hypothetical protein VGT82_13515, partial [Ktedonobacteraceae bacterium]|nr:hypothetical protein [Ktedonobacteraceae bacterium]
MSNDNGLASALAAGGATSGALCPSPRTDGAACMVEPLEGVNVSGRRFDFPSTGRAPRLSTGGEDRGRGRPPTGGK